MRVIAGLALALLVSCTSVATRIEDERERVAHELRARAGVSLDPLDASGASALLAQPLGLESAVELALALDPQARAAHTELDIATARRVRAGLIRNPALQLGLVQLDGETDLDLDLTQPLAELLTLGARIERADGELHAERARVARQLVRLAQDVKRDWIEAALAERRVKLAQERVEAEAAATRLAEELHDAGNVVDSVLTLSQLALGEARARLALDESHAAVALEQLARNFGSSGAQLELAPEPELRWPTWVDLERKVAAASLDLREARARVEAAARAAGIARWEVLLERSSLGLTARREDGREGAGATVALTLPLFDDGSAAKAEARARLELALARHAALELELRERTRSAEQRLVALAERHRSARDEQAPAASRHLDEVLRQYNAMQVGVFDVLAARRAELEAQEALLDSERDLWLVVLDLEELLAGSLPRESGAESAHVSQLE